MLAKQFKIEIFKKDTIILKSIKYFWTTLIKYTENDITLLRIKGVNDEEIKMSPSIYFLVS